MNFLGEINVSHIENLLLSLNCDKCRMKQMLYVTLTGFIADVNIRSRRHENLN